VHLEKVVSLHNSRDRSVSEPLLAADRRGACGDLRRTSALARPRLGPTLAPCASRCRHRRGEPGRVINLHMFHTLQVASPMWASSTSVGRAGPARRGYRATSSGRALRLSGAQLPLPRNRSALLAYGGAASTRRAMRRRRRGTAGDVPVAERERRPRRDPNMLFNSRSARWMPDRSSRQRHVGLAVAYELWQHWQSTGDTSSSWERPPRSSSRSRVSSRVSPPSTRRSAATASAA